VITPRTQPADGAVHPLGALLVSLAGDLAARGSATVVAGSSTGSGPGSPIAALRASTVTSQVSTVGNADFVSGQTMVIQALATQLNGGKPGSYGTEASGVVIVAPGAAATPTAANAERPSPGK
jgi:Copper transport outer membrane protein, MctB